jgi:ABC-type phosphate transport system substrate-binding protein
MRRRAIFPLALAAAFADARRAAGADDVPELAVIVHPAAQVKRLTRAQLAAIFTSSRQTWDDGSAVVAFTHTPDSPLRHAFDQAVLGMTPDQVGRYWVDQRVRGGPRPPRQLTAPGLGVKLVAKLAGAITFVPAAMVDASVNVVARIKGAEVREP